MRLKSVLNLRRFVPILSFSIALFAFAAQSAFAQAVAIGEVSGYVTDPSGQNIPNAKVHLVETSKEQVHDALSDSNGHYAFPNLPVGNYRMEVSAEGFKTATQTGIVLQVASNIEVNAKLQIGAVTENITISASAAMVETRENSIAQVIDEQRMIDLPLNGRNPTQLLTLTGAGTSNMNLNGGDLTGSKNMGGSNGSGQFSVAGGQANGVNFLLDGGDNNDAFSNVNMPIPFPDAIQEFSVQTNGVPAQYGLHPGGAVNIVTKSGGNALHGSVFEFLRNGDLNARQEGTLVRDSLKRSQFGGVAGGRIIRDKLFSFGGYQGTRQKSDPATSTSFVPTAAALNGDFSILEQAISRGGCLSAARTLKDGNGVPYTNNQIPTSSFDPAAVKLLKSYIPTSTDPCGKIQYGIPANNPDDQWIGRIDYLINAKHTFYGRYFIYDYTAQTTFNGTNALTTTAPGNQERSQTMTIGDTYSISPTLVNSFHATFVRRRDNRGAAANLFGPQDLGINMYQAVPNYTQLTVSNYFSIGCGTCASGYFDINTYQVADDFTWIKGKHQMAFGVDFRRDQFNSSNNQQDNGQISFNGNTTGDALADLLIGRMNSFVQGNVLSDYLRQTVFAFYAQDSFKVTPHMTINYGLRWEPSQPAYDNQSRGNRFDLGLFNSNIHSSVFPNAPAGLIFAGDSANMSGASLTATHWRTVSPRLGIVWDPKGDGRQTIRSSFTLMHDTAELFYPERWTTNPPYASSITLTNPTAPFSNPWLGYPGGNPFPGAAIFPVGGTYITIPADVKPQYMMQWNLSYQRQLGRTG